MTGQLRRRPVLFPTARGSGMVEGMVTGDSGRGLYAAADVHYPQAGGTRAAAVAAVDAAFARLVAECVAVLPEAPPYRPGQFYLRELPALRAVLRGLPELGLLIVDGYADLDPGGR